MISDEPPSGFLGRWSQRKTQARQGRDVPEPDILASLPVATPTHATLPASDPVPTQAVADQTQTSVPTLHDVQQLTTDSNFAQFMSHQVAPEVKNAALKKLFADPHFNVMDGLDIYIDDYNLPDPLPAGMLQQMTSIDGLNLFNRDDVSDTPAGHPDVVTPKVVAQSTPDKKLSITQPDTPAHDNADLRLQPNPADRPEGTEPKPE